MFLPPSTFETNDSGFCELCGEEREIRDLVDQEGHCVCPDCARMVRVEGVSLPSRLRRKRPSLRAVLREVRDFLILVLMVMTVVALARWPIHREKENSKVTLKTLLERENR